MKKIHNFFAFETCPLSKIHAIETRTLGMKLVEECAANEKCVIPE